MKRVLDFLNLQKEINEGMTEEHIKEKVDYVRELIDKFEEDPDYEKLRFLDKQRDAVSKEIRPHQKRRRKLDKELRFFAGQITPTEFKYKKATSFRSKDKFLAYIDERDSWNSGIDEIINSMDDNEILEVYVNKKKDDE